MEGGRTILPYGRATASESGVAFQQSTDSGRHESLFKTCEIGTSKAFGYLRDCHRYSLFVPASVSKNCKKYLTSVFDILTGHMSPVCV